MESVTKKPPTFSIGIDLGARVDPTAICLCEEVDEDDRYVVRQIERLPLDTSYSAVADRVGVIYRKLVARLTSEQELADTRADLYTMPYMRPPVDAARAGGRIAMYVDATGGGIPATEMIRAHPDLAGATITGVFITSGEHCTVKRGAREGSVGKAHLVGRLQSLLQPPARIELPPGEEIEALVDELRDYEIHRNESDGRLTAGVFKVGKHDDMATALGLAVLVRDPHYTLTSERYA